MKKKNSFDPLPNLMHSRRFFLFICCAWLLSGATGWAGSSPDGFVGVRWKATPAEAKKIMLSRDGVRVQEETPERLVFVGGTYAERPAERWELDFDFGHFQRGTVFLPVPPGIAKDGKPFGDHQFNDLIGELDAKYGKYVRPGNPGIAEALWKWNVSDPDSGKKIVRSVLLSFQWSPPLVFKVQYANQLPGNPEIPKSAEPADTLEASSSGAPRKKGDL